MADIDAFLKNVLGKGGEELFLSTGKAAQSRKGGTPTELAPGALQSERIEALLAEIVPARRMAGASFRFQYSAAFGQFRGIVQRTDGSITAIIRKAVLGEPSLDGAAPAAVAGPSVPPSPTPPPADAVVEPDLDSLSAAPAEEELSAVSAVPSPPPAPPPPKPRTVPAPAAQVAVPPRAVPTAAPPPAVTAPMQASSPVAVPAAIQVVTSASQRAAHEVYPPMEYVPPKTAGQPTAIDRLLMKMVQAKGSDLHLSSTLRPMLRVDGAMGAMQGENPLAPEAVWQLLAPIMPERNRREYDETRDTDFAYEIPKYRFRCNVFMDRKGPGGVFRTIPTKVLTADDLHLPDAVRMFSNLSKGLVLITGPTGSGKSTSLAALVDLVNSTRDDHIITIEDPIEFIHENKRCLVNQREVHSHTDGFKHSLRAALREDPDIVLVGEMRDLETIEIAIETAETGHLVFGTLHTTTAASTVNRIIEQFPADRQEQIRMMLSDSLKGVVSQTLCKRIGGGRIAALEILIVNSAVANMIREKKTHQLLSAQQTGKGEGMTLLSEILADYAKKGLIDAKEGYVKAVDKKGYLTCLENLKFNVQGLMAQLGAHDL